MTTVKNRVTFVWADGRRESAVGTFGDIVQRVAADHTVHTFRRVVHSDGRPDAIYVEELPAVDPPSRRWWL